MQDESLKNRRCGEIPTEAKVALIHGIVDYLHTTFVELARHDTAQIPESLNQG